MRCGNCAHDWFQERLPEEHPGGPAEPAAPAPPSAPLEAAAVAPAPEVEVQGAPAPGPALRPGPAEDRERGPRRAAARAVPPAPPAPPARRKARASVAIGWIVLLVLVAGLAGGAYVARERIVAALPAAAELYRLAGLPVTPPPGTGLELREVKSVRRLVDGERVVVIEGLVANVSNQVQSVPRLRASLTDATGAQVEQWTFSASDGTLPPGAVTGFETSTRNAPREGRLSIEFAPPD